MKAGRRGGPWAVRLMTAVLVGVGLVLGPVLMGPVYAELAPRLGPPTLIVVELFFALLIDVPLSGVFVAALVALGRAPRNPARAAIRFALTFFVAIGACIALSPVHPVFAWLGLSATFRPAVAASLQWLGAGSQGVLLACYLVFDLLLCAAAGMAAHQIVSTTGSTETDGQAHGSTATE